MAADDLTPEEHAEIGRVRDVLADPAVWTQPPLDLQERVVAAIAEEAGAGSGPGNVGARPPRRWLRYAVGVAAAAVLAAGGVAVGVQMNGGDEADFTAALRGTDLAPDATGEVMLTKTTSGWRIDLHATGLPRRAGGEFYEAWLKDEAGRLVPIGTFNDGREVILWAGAGPADFPTLTVTREVADGDQASSGQVVLVGRARRS